MGACLSCLGLGESSSEAERSRLIYPEDQYNQNGNNYGSYNGHGAPGMQPQNVMSPEEVRREQEALDNITRWASDQVVEIFPHQPRGMTSSQVSSTDNNGGTSSTLHHDILLSMIPGDKSKKSIRIYPASRPVSEASMRSKGSSKRFHSSTRRKDSSVFVKLNIEPI